MSTMKIAVVGGTGSLGSGLAWRLARAGYDVTIGSRDAERASRKAAELNQSIRGTTNVDAAKAGDVVFVTVPFAGQQEAMEEIKPFVRGKIVVDTTVPLVPPRVMRVQLPAEGSAAVKAAQLLGEGVRVASGFHNVAAAKLARDADVGCDILVFSDDKEARALVAGLADAIGLRGVQAGSLANSAAAEAMTSLLIFINKTYHVDGAGIRITGELVAPAPGDGTN